MEGTRELLGCVPIGFILGQTVIQPGIGRQVVASIPREPIHDPFRVHMHEIVGEVVLRYGPQEQPAVDHGTRVVKDRLRQDMVLSLESAAERSMIGIQRHPQRAHTSIEVTFDGQVDACNEFGHEMSTGSQMVPSRVHAHDTEIGDRSSSTAPCPRYACAHGQGRRESRDEAEQRPQSVRRVDPFPITP